MGHTGHDEGDCARELLEVVPAVMRFIRSQMRSHRGLSLSVAQFRTLVFIERSAGISLGGVAEHLGLTPPSACKLIDGLEGRGLITRTPSPEDRRRVAIEITAAGKRCVGDARRETRRSLSGVLSALDEGSRGEITAAMGMLRSVFVDRAVTTGRAAVNADS